MTLLQRQINAVERSIEVISKEKEHEWAKIDCALCHDFYDFNKFKCGNCPFEQFKRNDFGCVDFLYYDYHETMPNTLLDPSPEEIVSILYQVLLYLKGE